MDLAEVLEKNLGYGSTSFVCNVKGGIVNAGNARVYQTDKGKVFVKTNKTSLVSNLISLQACLSCCI